MVVDNAAVAGAASRLRAGIQAASAGLVEREAVVELLMLCAVAREHLLVIGPPGTAKSLAIRRATQVLGGRLFEYMLGRFTEPPELFGPIDLNRLREGAFETRTEGMLPEADIAFLDEVFAGSTAILNSLLTLLNERRFKRGHTAMISPLRVCAGASNSLPEQGELAAFADRFLVRVFARPISDSRLEELLAEGWGASTSALTPLSSLADLDLVTAAAAQADLGPIRPAIAEAVRALRAAGVHLSDRRVVKLQGLVAAAGALAGRQTPTDADLWPIVYAVPDEESQAVAREALRPLLSRAESGSLPVAAEEASAGPAARAARLGAALNTLLSAPEELGEASQRRARLKVEALLREVDAGFAEADLPPELAALRVSARAWLQAPAR